MISWAQYLQDQSDNDLSSSDDQTTDDFRGDSLHDADWDGQSKGFPFPINQANEDFTKQYNRQKRILQNGETSSQLPKRNPQGNVSGSVPAAAYTSREYDDTVDSLSRYAGRLKFKDDDSR